MTENDLAVVELSSFQLMGMKHSPHIAAITNLTPNHLDYHKDFDEYVQAKTAIYRNQGENDKLILNLDDEVTALAQGVRQPVLHQQNAGAGQRRVPQERRYLHRGRRRAP